jgi:RimJ/RimL family protein N-acetyltransferase
MREIRQSTKEELEKLCREVQLVPTGNLRGISLIVDGEAVLIVGYDGWTDGSVVMHQWCKHPRYYGRRMMHEAFRYPFEIAGLQVVLGTVRSDNPRALEINRKLGFLTAAIIPNAYGPGVDLHLLQLPRHLCKW